MSHHIISRLSILLIVQAFLAGILARPMPDGIVKPETDLVAGDDFNESTSVISHRVMANMEMATATVTAQPDMVSVTVQRSIVIVTVTTIETTVANTNASGSTVLIVPGTSNGNQSETSTIIYTAAPNNDNQTSRIKLASTNSTNTTPLTVGPGTSFWHATSTSSEFRGTGTDRTVTKLTTITSMASHSRPTSSFNSDLCDEIYCNTDGNKVCIYWAGITSWDISLGPLPGERPTIVGTC
ncbi:hypothetical protein O1611_g10002 [Lasiodiplodia mahajangana]|uniref:Uncharacterized protein n=1 Tax=Lasiodiplodia mahajangana TaxID=1108764 RepID=A0ACC2J2Z8_9PEZI|nr:hypothetical protein O1611_g10002 [Lasiodiplodia mahajangana]